jgi:hypothetical protein
MVFATILGCWRWKQEKLWRYRRSYGRNLTKSEMEIFVFLIGLGCLVLGVAESVMI